MRFGKPALAEKALEFINNAYKVYANRSGLEDNWEKYDRIFNSISGVKYYQGTADLFPPDTRRACKTLINFIDEVLFSSDPPFKVKGTGGETDMKTAEVLTKLLVNQSKKIKLRSSVRKFLWSLVKHGMVIVKAPWSVKERYAFTDSEQRKILRKMLMGEPVDEVAKKKMITDYDNIAFEVKDLKTMFFNPYVPWDKQECIIEESEVTWNHLKNLEKKKDGSGVYYNLEEVEAEMNDEATKTAAGNKTHPQDQSEVKKKEYAHTSDLTGITGDFKIGKKSFKIREAWCKFDIDGDGLDEECVIGILDGKHVVRLDINPYDIQKNPYLSTVWEPIEGTCLGQGVPQLCEKSQIGLNDFVNQIMDNITQILNNMWIVDDLAEIPTIQLKSRPNGIIRSKQGVEAVKAVVKQLTASEGLKAVAMQKDDIRNISGATVSLQGLPAKYGTTLGEYKSQEQSSARDVFANMRAIEDDIIIPFLERAYSYDMQFLTRADFIRLVGKDAAETFLGSDTTTNLAEKLRGDYDFVAEGVSQLENKVVQLQQLTNFLNITLSAPPGIVDLPYIFSRIWKLSGDDHEIILPEARAELIAPADENLLLAQGEKVTAKPHENHIFHNVVHRSGQYAPEFVPNAQEHMAQHDMFAQQMAMAGKKGAPAQEQPRGLETTGGPTMATPGLPDKGPEALVPREA